ncbi:MAG: DUF2735 domain-containing protein [Xanthobacteraceae bacterium]
MSENTQRQSAKIYGFPARGRFAVGQRHEESKPIAELPSARMKLVSGGAWYHDEAINDAGLNR